MSEVNLKIIGLNDIKVIIRADINAASNSFVSIECHLKYVRDNELYREDGYSGILEFAQSEFGISKSWASKWMSINDKFSVDGNSPILLEQYRDFSSGKLSEMLYLTEEQREQITIVTTTAEIREIKNPAKEKVEVNIFSSTKTEEAVKPSNEPEVILSAIGEVKTVRPIDSLLTTPGCGNGKYNCFCCGRECNIRQEERKCRFSNVGTCTTMNVNENLVTDIGDKCMFINLELAPIRSGDKEPSPCCKDCAVKCGYACNRAAHQAITKPEYKPDISTNTKKTIDFAQSINSMAKEREATGGCPPNQNHCDKEWNEDGTGKNGSADCIKCWKVWLEAEKVNTNISDLKVEKPEVGIYIYDVGGNGKISKCKVISQKSNISEDYFLCESNEGEMSVSAKSEHWYLSKDEAKKDPWYKDDTRSEKVETVDADVIQTEPEPSEPINTLSFAKEILAKHNERLSDALKVMKDESKRTRDDNRYIERLKIEVAAIAGYICDLDTEDIPGPEQPELPILKNNDQRKEFIEAYTSWPIWIDTEPTGERYYRYDFDNSESFVIRVSLRHSWEHGKYTNTISYGKEEYYILTDTKKYDHEPDNKTFCECSTNMSALIDYLKDIQKK